MANLIYKAILYIIHSVINIYSVFFNIFLSYTFSNKSFFGQNAIIDFKNDSKSLQKLPLHIGIIITDDNFVIHDIASILIWCVGIGISYISIYDPKGIIKQNRDCLEETVKDQQQYHQLHGNCIQICSQADFNKANKDNIGASSKEKKVVLLSREDCCCDIVKTTKHMAAMIRKKQLKYTDINTTSVDAVLQEYWGFPDPDLLITCGKVESLLGYFPWQTRLSEILSIPTVHNISYRTFISKLEQYANTKQRFGK